MSVTVQIRQKSLFRNKLSARQIVKLSGLSCGVYDKDNCLQPDELDRHGFVLYDAQKPARGIEVALEGTQIFLHINLPSTVAEINNFYDLVDKICGAVETESCTLDDQRVTAADRERLCAEAVQTSLDYLQLIRDELQYEPHVFKIFGACHPLALGYAEMDRIGGTLEGLEAFLTSIQSTGAEFAAPRFFRVEEDELIGVYNIEPDTLTIVPTEPYLMLNDSTEVTRWYLLVEDHMVAYEDFIRLAGPKTYFDVIHVMVTMTQDEIDALVRAYAVRL